MTLPVSQTSLHVGFPDYEICSKTEPSAAAASWQELAHVTECGLSRVCNGTALGNPMLEDKASS